MPHPPKDSARISRNRPRFRTSLALLFSLTSALALPVLLGIPIAFAAPARAAEHLTPVQLWIGGQARTFSVAPLSDGTETYVPLETLALVGAEGKVNTKGDAVLVTLSSKRQEELALARPNGKPMLALSDLARLISGVVYRPDSKDTLTTLQKPAAPIKNRKSKIENPTVLNTAPGRIYLLARVTEAHLEDGQLHISTSFPVPSQTRMLTEEKPLRGYVDCVGAVFTDDFRLAPLPEGEQKAKRMRFGQNSPDIARVVIEIEEGATLQSVNPVPYRLSTIVAMLKKGESKTAQAAKIKPPVRIAEGHVQKPGKIGPPRSSGTDTESAELLPKGYAEIKGGPEGGSKAQNPGDRNSVPGSSVSSSGSDKAKTSPPPAASKAVVKANKPSRGNFKREAQPIEIRGIAFSAEDDSRVRLDIATAGKVRALVRYVPGTTQMTVELPNTLLNLQDAGEQRSFAHPLIGGLRAEIVVDPAQNPTLPAVPTTRLTLDTNRIVGFTINAENDHLALELRVPRNATGALADKVIVVDAGHGGGASGAPGVGFGGTVYEKDITLAIALKLRTALESCGAKVVMTRDHDVDIPLYDRPRLANEIHADLFFSIHNDSNGTPNSASGTSTYYHASDPSCRALAICVQDAVRAVTGLPSRGALSDSILYSSGLAVLRSSTMPAVLCEVAYINNAGDRKKLLDPDFQERVAYAMCDGLRNYIEGNPPISRRPPVFNDEPEKKDNTGEEPPSIGHEKP